ncbi:MAG: hypothetical protein ACP5RI_01480 [Candidatus Micrarchaeia archaeon]
MEKKGSNSLVFALELIGSLFYLFTVYELISGALSVSLLFGVVGSFWLPVFASLAVISSIILFFYSFTYLSRYPITMNVGSCTLDGVVTAIGAITLIALTFSSMTYLSLTLIGFIIAFIGVMLTYKK